LNRLSCRRAGQREEGSLAQQAWLEYSAIVHLNIVNPNTSAAMTRIIAAAAAKVARPGTTIRAVESAFGPASIEGFYDDAFAVPGLLARVAEGEAASSMAMSSPASTIPASTRRGRWPMRRWWASRSCVPHGLPALPSLRRRHHASRSIPVVDNLGRYGLDRRCARVRRRRSVLALDNPTSNARARIGDEIARALDEDGADAIVLGCAGMADLTASLSREFGVPVVDGVAAAVALAEGLAALGLSTSRRGGYARPLPKDYSGIFAPFSPSDEA
jgi:allantoin racemase